MRISGYPTRDDIQHGPRKHAQPGAGDVRGQVDGGQAIEVVGERKRQQRAQAQQGDHLEPVLADRLVHCPELVVLFC